MIFRSKRFILLGLTAVLLIMGASSGALAAPGDPWINEIHYDNTGADADEGLEIAGLAGTDLTVWSLVLYNGNGGASYGTENLTGTIPDQGNGFGAVFFPISGLQNGSPDGMALVGPGDVVSQFLSYEGSFTAVGGPADGLTSTDIGVSEPGDSPVGDSLQLTGTGSTYTDFTWATAMPNTYNAVNTNQIFSGGGGDSAPFVSNTIPGDGATNVAVDSNIEITFSEDVATTGNWFDISCISGGTFIATESGGPQTFTLNPTSDFSNGDTCNVTIFASQVNDIDTDDPPDNMANDFAFIFTTAAASIPAGVVINEVDYDQEGADDGEFIEIRNGTAAATSLDTYEVHLVNGNNGTVYDTIALPAVLLAADDYFVICSNVANVPNCDLEDLSSIQNGAPDAVALVESSSGNIVDTVSYEGDTAGYTEGSGVGLTDDQDDGYSSISRFPDGVDTDQNNVDFSPRCATPGEANSADDTDCAPPTSLPCEDAFTAIYDIQGSGAVSALEGTIVTTEGIVTAVYLGSDSLDGFNIQDDVGDGLPETSDGIFVFAPASSVTIGDRVRVTGTVAEINDLTEITNVTDIIECGEATPVAATPVTLPVNEVADLEMYEGMLITFPQTLAVTDTFNVHRFGEVVVSANGRQWNPTNNMPPGPTGVDNDGNSIADINETGRLLVDDASNVQFPDTVPYLAADNTLRLGDTVQELTGTLGYSSGSYRLQPTETVTFNRSNPRPDLPESGTDIKVASFNVLNYWTTIDDGNNGARGADSATEFERQQAKTVTAILAMDADIVGLQELENNGAEAIGDLVAALNAATAPGTWAYIADPAYPGGLESTNAIKVGLIYQTASVTPVGNSIADEDPIFATERPPIAQTFDADGERFTVVVNHFKSKGCTNATGADQDQNDGQGCFNEHRTLQAQALLDFVTNLQSSSGDDDVIAIGDFNSYAQEDPITTLSSGLINQTLAHVASEDLYSFNFFGQSGLLDYAFSTESLNTNVVGVNIWHVNADEPRGLSYNDEFIDPAESGSELEQDYLYVPDQYRSSDHDPVIVHLNFGLPTNDDGCYVIALEGSPFTGQATIVKMHPRHRVFYAHWWAKHEGLPKHACFEIHGTNAPDIIFGGHRADTFFGYDARDLLIGGFGNDTFTGGAGPDKFLGGWGYDTVLDFEPGIDRCKRIEAGCRKH